MQTGFGADGRRSKGRAANSRSQAVVKVSTRRSRAGSLASPARSAATLGEALCEPGRLLLVRREFFSTLRATLVCEDHGGGLANGRGGHDGGAGRERF